jgi:hypothetical protein
MGGPQGAFDIVDAEARNSPPHDVNAQGYVPLRVNATPAMRRVFELLDQAGGSMRFLEVFEKSGPLIPPGQAFRKARYNQRLQHRKRGTPVTDASLVDMDSVIRSGRRMILRDSLQTFIQKGRLRSYRDENGVEWVELIREWRPKRRRA